MLITQLKDKNTLEAFLQGKAFMLICHGCREVHFPEAEVAALEKDWQEKGILTGSLTTDYICNPENLKLRLEKCADAIQKADAIFVFSCGVGVQTVAEACLEKRVYAACDTFPLPGFQGVTPQQVDCGQCGQCYLNITGGICPITACSKSLVNGQCGGAKNGKCEVDPTMDCGWERIYRRLAQLDRLDVLKCPVQVRDYHKD